MFSRHFYLHCALMWMLSISFAQAGAPPLSIGKCLDREGHKVQTRFSSSIRVFAEVRVSNHISNSTQSHYEIYVNPERYYLGRYTQQWLYYRQCSLLQQEDAVIQKNMRRLDIEREKEADCAAVKMMRDNHTNTITNRLLNSIERDIDRVISERRWTDVLPGPERRIKLVSCPTDH